MRDAVAVRLATWALYLATPRTRDGVVPAQGAYAFRFLLDHLAVRLAAGVARWFVGCGTCRHEVPGHHPGCIETPVSDKDHRRKLLDELADPGFAPIARERLVQLEGFKDPKLTSKPGRDRYQHQDCTTYRGEMRMFWIPKAGVWWLTPDGDLINLEGDASDA